MFYSRCLLSRKGALGVIWVAASCFKRLKKAQVFDTDIPSSVDDILQNELDAVTYRVLAYLLLGLVRIYSKKVEYLFDDCHNVMIKINDFVVTEKSKSQSENLSLPYYSITLPERFELDAFDLGILEDVSGDNIVPHEEITLKDCASKAGEIALCSLRKYHCEEFSAWHDAGSTDYLPTENIFSSHSIEIDMNVSTSHEFSNFEASMEKLRGNSFFREEWVNLDSFCGIKGKAADPIKPSGEDYKIDGEHINVPAIAQSENEVQGKASTEMLQDDRFHGDGEEPLDLVNLYGDDHQSNGEQLRVSNLAQMENEDSNLIDLEASTEKLLHHRFPQEVHMDVEMCCRSEDEGPKLIKPSGEEHHSNAEQMKSLEISLSGNDKCLFRTGEDPVSITLDTTPQSKFPDASGHTSPEFMFVGTPTTKEPARILRKRKCSFDDVTVFPNDVIRRCIEDASDLVSRRRKGPYTARTPWKALRILNLSQGFLVPLLPCISSELKSLFCQGRLEIPKTSKTVEPLAPESPTANALVEQAVMAPETPAVRCLKRIPIDPETPKTTGRSSEQFAIAPKTPIFDSMATRPSEIPERHKNSHSDTVRPAHSFDIVEKEPSKSKDQEFDFMLMNEETNSFEADDGEPDGLSERTRMVARYLHKSFLYQKKRREDEAVNLLQLLEGKSKKESARLFYEILVLRTREFVDVRQDEAYGDILIQKVAKWEQSYGALCL